MSVLLSALAVQFIFDGIKKVAATLNHLARVSSRVIQAHGRCQHHAIQTGIYYL